MKKYKFEYEYEIQYFRVRCLLSTILELDLPLHSDVVNSQYDAYDIAYEYINFGLLAENIIVIGGKKGCITYEEGNENYSIYKILEGSKSKPYISIENDFEKVELSFKDLFEYAKKIGKKIILEQNKEYIKMDFIYSNVYEV